MTEPSDNFDSIQQDRPVQLSVKELQAKRFQPRLLNKTNNKKLPLRLQVSRPPRNSVKIKPEEIPVYFKWSLVLTILCFFIIGPCWALYRTYKLRRMIQRQELEAATHLSHRILTVLIFSTVIGVVVWIAILFCSVGLLLTGELEKAGSI
jgi:hypothetical protein